MHPCACRRPQQPSSSPLSHSFPPQPRAQAPAQARSPEPEARSPWSSATWSGLRFRSIGPALTSGRVSDLAVDPAKPSRWYVAAASGGVWKTENAGTSWTPIFDTETSFSIGCVTLDPSNPLTVWVGTGENKSQRSVWYGDGVYRSDDGGKSWRNLGLKASEHIGKILVHPKDSNIVFVAAQGPLWSAGGDRGLYKTTDGGKTWKAVLTVSEHTGATDVVMDPRNPNVLLAATHQRRRHVWTLINGGPESAIYKSTDGGDTWRKITRGLPTEDMGRIGLAISPADPYVVYATIEAANDAQGMFRSTDGGETWEKRSSYVAQGMYYGEIFADPKNRDRVYAVDVLNQVSDDGARTWRPVGESSKHVDNHVIWIDPTDTDHLIVGCDGGVYESHDRGANWEYKANLPITQFYRVDVDDSSPVYYVYGGTQDNNSLGGPSRTLDRTGIKNSDWFVTWGGDGFHSRVEPGNPNIVYATLQHGVLARYDRKSGEAMLIQPQEGKGEPGLRWNWDSPLLISPHSPDAPLLRGQPRVSQRRSRQLVEGHQPGPHAPGRSQRAQGHGQGVGAGRRGQEPVHVDLREHRVVRRVTQGAEPALRRHRRWARAGERGWRRDVEEARDVPRHPRHDLRERPLRVGPRPGRRLCRVQQPQDGRLQAIPAAQRRPRPHVDVHRWRPPGTGQLVDHRRGSRRPGPVVHRDRVRDLLQQGRRQEVDPAEGRPAAHRRARHGVPEARGRPRHRHLRPRLLRAGRLHASAPRNAVGPRDKPAVTFPVKKVFGFMPSSPIGGRGKAFLGEAFYAAPNPPFGAVFTYYLKDAPKTRKQQRVEAEKAAEKKGEPGRYPTRDDFVAESREEAPSVIMTVTDATGAVVRRITGPARAGVHRVAWNLRYPSTAPTAPARPGAEDNPFFEPPSGPMVVPGTYQVSYAMRADGKDTPFGTPQEFEVAALNLSSLPEADRAQLLAFQKKTASLQRAVLGASAVARETQDKLDALKRAIEETPAADPKLAAEVRALDARLKDLNVALTGDNVMERRYESVAALDPGARQLDRPHALEHLVSTHRHQPAGLRDRRRRVHGCARTRAPARGRRPEKARVGAGGGGRPVDAGARARLEEALRWRARPARADERAAARTCDGARPAHACKSGIGWRMLWGQ